MSSSFVLTMILAPILLLGFLIGISLRNQQPEVENTKSTTIESIVFIGNLFGGILAVVIFLNNIFGAILLCVAGVLIIWQGKIFNTLNWVNGNFARLFGATWLVAGIFVAWANIK